MKKTAVLLFVAMFLAVSAVPAYSGEEAGNAKALFESKCGLCHSIERPKSKQKSKEGWEATVMRMKNKNGCPVSDEEAKAIIDYLSEKFGK